MNTIRKAMTGPLFSLLGVLTPFLVGIISPLRATADVAPWLAESQQCGIAAVETTPDASVSGESCECLNKTFTFRIVIVPDAATRQNPRAMKLINLFNHNEIAPPEIIIGPVPCEAEYGEVVERARQVAETHAGLNRMKAALKRMGAGYRVDLVDSRVVELVRCCLSELSDYLQ